MAVAVQRKCLSDCPAESNRLKREEVATVGSQRSPFVTMLFMTVKDFLIPAVGASFFGLPDATGIYKAAGAPSCNEWPLTVPYAGRRELWPGLSRIKYFCRISLPHPNRYSTKVVASNKILPKTREAATWRAHLQDGEAGTCGVAPTVLSVTEPSDSSQTSDLEHTDCSASTTFAGSVNYSCRFTPCF